MFLFLSLIVLIGFIGGIYRIFPYFSSNIPLGYDPGLYRSYFLDYYEHLPNINLVDLDIWVKQMYEPGLGLLTNILQINGFGVDILLTWGFGVLSIITGLFLYLVLKPHNKIAGILAMSMYWISIIQYKVFWWNYIKQTLGIIFLLVCIYLIEKKKYVLAFPMILSLFIINRPSGVFFVLMLVLYQIIIMIQEKKILWKEIGVIGGAGLLATGIYIPLFQEQILNLIQPLTTTVMSEGRSGTFFSKEDFGTHNLYIIILALGGIFVGVGDIIRKKRNFDLLDSGFIIGILWTSLGLFFYNRFLIFFDIFLIISGSKFLYMIFTKSKVIFIIITSLFFILQGQAYYTYVSTYNSPLISQKEFDKIKDVSKVIPENSSIMVTNSSYSPWLIGYTRKQVIAPGLFEWDKWDRSQWEQWWRGNGVQKCNMLQDYKKYFPLYIRIGSKQPQENYENASCLELIFQEGKNIIYKVSYAE